MRQDLGWFDREENASGILVTRLTNDAATVHCEPARELLLSADP